MIEKIPLTGWTLRLDADGPTAAPVEAAALAGVAVLAGRRVPATVPGSVHADLLSAGLIPDPLVADNEQAVAWMSHTDWRYECPIAPVTDAERVDLVFDGIDTVARIILDDGTGPVEIGRSRNMHRSYRYDVTDRIARGPHLLAVHLSSAYTEARLQQDRLGPRPNAYPEPFNFVRKMACSFGWDWGPTVPGAGIWRPARLEAWHGARIARMRPLMDVDAGTGLLRVLLDVERAPSTAASVLHAQVLLDDHEVATGALAPGDDGCELTAAIPRVRRWQPVGHGEPERYRMTIVLADADGTALDRVEHRIGFRRLRLDRSADHAGTRFQFRIDERPVLVKGVNWIPGDLLPGRMTEQRYRTLLQAARDAGVNLIRVWGGGLYETDEFYDIADELGLLVWQDFAFACAAYPEDEPLRGEIRAEAAENVARLARHPSLVLWNGNNESLWLRGAEHWTEQPGGEKPWGDRYYFDDLPAIVGEVDPSRPYTPGSPWSGSWAHDPNDPAHQTHHSWDVWNRQDYAHYRDATPRFVAEFGWQAPATWRTLREARPGERLTPDSPGIRHRQKAAGGMAKLRRGLEPHAALPADTPSADTPSAGTPSARTPPADTPSADTDDFDAWHFLMQWNQVRALATGISHWRAHWPHTAGTILWQLNDVWPALSWSAIDSAGRCKPLYHALRELYAARALTIQPVGPTAGAALQLCALNDSDEPWTGQAIVTIVGDDGSVAARAGVPVVAPARGVGRVAVPDALCDFHHPRRQVLVAELDGMRAWWYPCEPKDSDFGGAAPDIEIAAADGGLRIRLTATAVLRDVLVQADRIHPGASADRGFLSLLPGETATVTVRCPDPLAPDAAHVPYAIAWLDSVRGRSG